MAEINTAFSFTKSKRLYQFVWSQSASQQIGVCLIALLTLPLTLAPIELQRRIIDDAINTADTVLLVWLVCIYAAVIILQQLTKFTYNYYQGRLSERLIRRMRESILNGLGPDDKAAEEDGTVVSMLSGEVEPVGVFGGNAFAQLVTEGGVLLAILGYMLFTEFWLAVVAIIAFVPQAIATPLLQNRINEQSAKRLVHIRAVGDDAVAIGRGEQRHKKGLHRILQIFKHRLTIFRFKFILKAILNLCDHAADLAVLGVGGYMVIIGQTDIGVVVAFLSGLSKLRSPWRTLVVYFRLVSDTQLRFELLQERLSL